MSKEVSTEKTRMVNVYLDEKRETSDYHQETMSDMLIERKRSPVFGKVCLIQKDKMIPLLKEILMDGEDWADWVPGKVAFKIKTLSKRETHITDHEVISHVGIIDLRTSAGRNEAKKIIKALRAWFEIQLNQKVWKSHFIAGYFQNDAGIFSLAVNSVEQGIHFIAMDPFPSPFDKNLKKVRFLEIVRRKKKIL